MKLSATFIFILTTLSITAQPVNWGANMERPDGNKIAFTFNWTKENSHQVWYIKNAEEQIKVDNITKQGDSFFVQMPVFESQFRFVIKDEKIQGYWIKKGVANAQVLPFVAIQNQPRFMATAIAKSNVTGRWAAHFGKDTADVSVAEFVQKGNLVTGTFLNATGDFRYLEGIVTNDTLLLSGFDGGHAFLFKAVVKNDTVITNGMFYAGAKGKEEWVAARDAKAAVSEKEVAMFTRPGKDKLDFVFKDLQGKQVSINDEKFKNKVVVIQLMGSWCPNCMDETAFLSSYYNKNKQRGVEVIALAYEYTTNWERSVNSLKKFQQRFNVQYTILNTGVTVTDSLRTEKTLPQVTPIKFFPSSIIIDKKGKIRKFDTGFNGPATGTHYIAYKQEFEQIIDDLLNEK